MNFYKKLSILLLIALTPCLGFSSNTTITKRSDVGYQGPSNDEIAALPLVATLQASGDADTDIKNFQEAINAASRKKGGRIIVSAGKYQLKDVDIKSNVHILFKKGVEITPRLDLNDSTKAQLIFTAGRLKNQDVSNVTFIGEGDISSRPHFSYDRSIALKCRVLSVGKVTNLYVQNISISDGQTKFSAISLNLKKNGTTKDDRAKNVTIKDVSIDNASYGYGLVQGNVGENLWLKNLQAVGGVAARIETHTGREYNVGIDNVVIEDVMCTRGKAAVTMQPHVIDNGVIIVDGVKAINCEWGVMIKDGFISRKLPKDQEWTMGTFAKGSYVKNVEMIHGFETTLSVQSKIYIPESLLNFYLPNSNPDKEVGAACKLGPSIAAVLNLANEEVAIDTATVSHSGKRADERLLIVTEEATRGTTLNHMRK